MYIFSYLAHSAETIKQKRTKQQLPFMTKVEWFARFSPMLLGQLGHFLDLLRSLDWPAWKTMNDMPHLPKTNSSPNITSFNGQHLLLQAFDKLGVESWSSGVLRQALDRMSSKSTPYSLVISWTCPHLWALLTQYGAVENGWTQLKHVKTMCRYRNIRTATAT